MFSVRTTGIYLVIYIKALTIITNKNINESSLYFLDISLISDLFLWQEPNIHQEQKYCLVLGQVYFSNSIPEDGSVYYLYKMYF